jgi:hypothetical protein
MTSNTEIVNFNVGGVQYHVARDTVLNAEETMLKKLVSDKWTAGHDEESIFIDRDGERFKYILDWYRDGKIIVPKTVALDAVKSDAEFFGLPENAIIEKELPVDSCDKLLSVLSDGAKYLEKLNATFDESVLEKTVSIIAIWAIQEMLKSLNLSIISQNKIEIDLLKSTLFESKKETRPLVKEEIRRILLTDKFLSATKVTVRGCGPCFTSDHKRNQQQQPERGSYWSRVRFEFL